MAATKIWRYVGRHHWGMLATFIVLGGSAYAVSGGHTAAVHACVSRHTGAVRIARRCHRGERGLTWAKAGPRGLPGLVGQTGPSDGYYSSTTSGNGTVVSLKLPAGDYIATGGCSASLTQTESDSDTVPVFGAAQSLLTTSPLAASGFPGVPGTTYGTSSSVPNRGVGQPTSTRQIGSASLSTSGAFHLPQGGTIYEVCQSVPGYHGLGHSVVPVDTGGLYISAIRVGTLHQT